MDRRESLAVLGAAAIGLSPVTPTRADHGTAQPKGDGPLGQMHLYVCAFHLAKKDPKLVFEAHHYCMPVSDGVHQCVIFDGTGKTAKLLGVEYIIADKLYRALPAAEKKYYHPHTYEVTAGLLIAPGMKPADEDKLMEGLVTTWGKTWHTWPDPKQELPMSDPLLMWAATKDGMVGEDILAGRDKAFKVSTTDLRKRRAYIGPVPQIDPPKSVDDVGRQWTNEGPDEPKKK
ncbi:MAG: OBAP family protein [Gemmataceae bacterium]|nr:OBAP family protein [Gemmataceae bacterium]